LVAMGYRHRPSTNRLVSGLYSGRVIVSLLLLVVLHGQFIASGEVKTTRHKLGCYYVAASWLPINQAGYV